MYAVYALVAWCLVAIATMVIIMSGISEAFERPSLGARIIYVLLTLPLLIGCLVFLFICWLAGAFDRDVVLPSS